MVDGPSQRLLVGDELEQKQILMYSGPIHSTGHFMGRPAGRVMGRAAGLALVLGAGLSAASGAAQAPSPEPDFVWDARAAEHLWNRAGFGASRDQIEWAVARGREGFVEWLLELREEGSAAWYGEQYAEGIPAPEARNSSPVFDLDEVRHSFPAYYEDIGSYLDGWIGSMLRGDDPLRDRMALFWHNHFTSSFMDVLDARKLVEQARCQRVHALGSFRVLVRSMARDPAMLAFLDNDLNVRSHPNENWARELLELFTLGEGNYSERDIKETARAFTGWTVRDGQFAFDRLQHDFGPKTVLGVTGDLDGDDVIDIVLADPNCALFLAQKLLTYFEGLEPEPERARSYARILSSSGYDFSVFARALFTDDAFYRPACVGASIAGPVEYLVGTARRFGIEPPVQLVYAGAQLLGQRLFDPPTVKGWEGGLAWLGTGDVMHRGNLVAALLGRIDWTELVDPNSLAASPKLRKVINVNDATTFLLYVQRSGWRPALDLRSLVTRRGAHDDASVVAVLLDELLAVPPAEDLQEHLFALARDERQRLGLDEAPFSEPADPRVEQWLRSTAQLIASLPAAQLQ